MLFRRFFVICLRCWTWEKTSYSFLKKARKRNITDARRITKDLQIYRFYAPKYSLLWSLIVALEVTIKLLLMISWFTVFVLFIYGEGFAPRLIKNTKLIPERSNRASKSLTHSLNSYFHITFNVYLLYQFCDCCAFQRRNELQKYLVWV